MLIFIIIVINFEAHFVLFLSPLKFEFDKINPLSLYICYCSSNILFKLRTFIQLAAYKVIKNRKNILKSFLFRRDFIAHIILISQYLQNI